MREDELMDEVRNAGRKPGPSTETVFPLASILATAREYLAIDVVFLTHLRSGDEVFLFR